MNIEKKLEKVMKNAMKRAQPLLRVMNAAQLDDFEKRAKETYKTMIDKLVAEMVNKERRRRNGTNTTGKNRNTEKPAAYNA